MPPFNGLWVGLGAFGALLPDAIRFAKHRQDGFPEWFKKPGYWAGLIVLVVLGAVAAYFGQAVEWKAAVAMGYGAPEFLSRLVAKDTVEFKGESKGFPLRKWWSQ